MIIALSPTRPGSCKWRPFSASRPRMSFDRRRPSSPAWYAGAARPASLGDARPAGPPFTAVDTGAVEPTTTPSSSAIDDFARPDRSRSPQDTGTFTSPSVFPCTVPWARIERGPDRKAHSPEVADVRGQPAFQMMRPRTPRVLKTPCGEGRRKLARMALGVVAFFCVRGDVGLVGTFRFGDSLIIQLSPGGRVQVDGWCRWISPPR